MKEEMKDLELPQGQSQYLYYTKFFEAMIKQLKSIEALTLDQQLEKYRMFAKKYEKFFNVKLKE